ncbi:DUF1917 domain-containing protein [Rhizobium pisi]|uniref:putative phosphothreonine lyase domain-containing protein n=1 Tax=Rhizobium pisi TaxID=574561 RepID=UPI001038BF0E|nr:putative phosphothreonine lyase domain-containg protein [Rhizobium pisi]TCA62722.1 DUF1917 domain-containing protein [Rhizobium pisi]
MLWYPTLSKSGFRSIISDTDEASTGKWLVPITVPDIGLVWEEIEDAAVEGRLTAVKKSTPQLRKQIARDLVCVYCTASDADTVAETLAILREIGVTDELRYKSDRATSDGREEYLWQSDNFRLTAKMAL